MKRRPGPSAGLTLIEVMAASALMAVFFASLFSIVWQSFLLRDELERKAIPFAAGPAVLQRVVDDLSFIVTEPLKDDYGLRAELEDVGGSDATRIDFVAAVTSRAEVEIRDEWVRAKLNEVGYRARRSENEQGLLALYRREDLGVDDDPLEGGDYHKLCDRVREFTIDWYEEDPGDPGGEDARGVTEWDAKKEKKLPWGCRIRLVLVGASVRDDADEADTADYVFETFHAFRWRHDEKADK